ncbi:LacI family transcriptional regulator [Schleiferilactobacillus harbinensis]|nr:LacI family transcriptional regulator [Schleiferilactobacillus harbinensis]
MPINSWYCRDIKFSGEEKTVRPKIDDVARAANVSKATVSRYLNGHFERMSPATKTRIAAVIEEMDYVPNRQASALKSRRTHLVGVVVADVSNMYSTRLIAGISELTKEAGDQILIADSANDPGEELRTLQLLLGQNVDGIILQPLSTDPHTYDFIQAQGVQLVMVDRTTTPVAQVTITSSDYAASRELAEAIVKARYQDLIVFANPIAGASSRRLRYQGFADVAQEHGLSITLLETGDDSPKEKDAGMIGQWLTSHPGHRPAVFTTNGRLLMAALTWMQDQGLRAPRDLGICGYDDWDWARLAGPGVTSVNQHPQRIGQTAARYLYQAIAGQPAPAQRIEIPADVTLRHSL